MTSSTYLQMLLALLFVLGLMGLLTFILKRMGLAASALKPGQIRRLQIIETLPLTSQHRAILMRRDGAEHLVIVGPNGETVVETGITNPPSAS